MKRISPTKRVPLETVLRRLKALYSPKAVEGMARFGINPKNTLGVSIPNIRRIAKDVGRDHVLAQELWASGIHETRILAGVVDDSEQVTERQMENWVRDFDSWDVCDQVCGSLFDKTPLAYPKAMQWSRRKEEFVKRAGFVLMASLAVHDKKAKDRMFAEFLPIMRSESVDDRNFVKKAVNWALRQIGKRNLNLNKMAVHTAREIRKMNSKAVRWIASDALRELTDKKVLERLRAP